MDIQGQAVSHRTFGRGVITALSESTVTVRFDTGEKRFLYPDAFRQHLVLKDDGIRENVRIKMEERRIAEERRRKLQQAEQERRRKLRDFSVRVNSHAVFDIDPARAAQACGPWSVSTGRYISGHSRGKPRIAERLKPNSACLLSALPAGEPEQSRRILRAFMARADFFGEDCGTGLIEGHPEYRMSVPDGQTLMLWEYFDQDAAVRWGGAAFKYCSAAAMNRILAEMAQMNAGTENAAAALDFYRYFCRMNRVRPLIETGTAPAGAP